MFNLPVKYHDLEWWQRRNVRNQYVNEQGGKCRHCGGDLKADPKGRAGIAPIKWGLFPKTFRKYPVHLHHDHTTGLTIGAVHMRCNAYLWQYKGE